MAISLWPGLGMTAVLDEEGGTVPAAGISVSSLTPYYVALVVRGHLVTYDPLDADSSPATVTTQPTLFASTTTALALTEGGTDTQIALVSGHTTAGDGGGGLFTWYAGDSTTADGGTVLGTGSGRWKRVYSGAVSVRWFGAAGDGTTDDTSKIVAALAAGLAANAPVVFPACSVAYAVSTTITMPEGIDVEMVGAIVYTGSSDIPIISVGDSGEYNTNRRLTLSAYRLSQADWTDEACVAIQIHNLYTSKVRIVRADHCTIGVQCKATGSKGFVYNDIELGEVKNNKIGLDLTSGTSGWCNENSVHGGRFWAASVNTTTSRYGVRITSTDSYYQNNNHFYKPSFELNAASLTGGAEAVTVLIEYGVMNTFRQCRFEGNDVEGKFSNASENNHIEVGYGGWSMGRSSSPTLDDSSTTQANTFEVLYHRSRRHHVERVVFDAGPVWQTACWYNGSTQVHVPKCFGIDQSTGTVTTYVANTTLAIDATMRPANSSVILPYTDGIGTYVDTSTAKAFTVRRTAANAYYAGRIGIACFDSSGVRLTSAGGGHPYVQVPTVLSATWTTDFGGCYESANDGTIYSEDDYGFTVGADVAYIQVFIFGANSGAVTTAKLRSFKIFTAKPWTPSAWVTYPEIEPGANLGTTHPTTSTWLRGRKVLNVAPSILGSASSQYIIRGWEKVTTGAANVADVDWVELRTLTGT